MVEIPEGYTELELVGFTDKGSYADGTSYVKNDLVHYGGAIYKCIVDDTVDVLPSNTSCWEVFILNHSNLDSIIAVDTEGKLGTKGEEVSAQQLVDKISRDTNKMVGATSETDGSIGLVPPPRAGDEDKALLGNGTWGKVDSIYKYKTEEEYNQAVANNEIPDGATVIKEWDEELSVIPVDSELSEESLNPLQNKVIAQKISELNQSIEELNGLLGGKLDVSKIANNLVTTEEGYALDARMGKELGKRLNLSTYVSNSLDFKELANGKSVTVSISIQTDGIYMLMFDIMHCGASEGIAPGGHWVVGGIPTSIFGLQLRNNLCIPISCSWDDISGNSFRLSRLSARQYDFTFTNLTGISTSNAYNSTVAVTAIPLKED